MKTKKTILSLAISALLTTGVASYPIHSFADSKTSDSSKSNSSSSSSSSKSSDSDSRGNSDKSSQKITICHVPPGNPAQKHTIHIAFSAWAAHKAHTNTKGPDFADYLGSCNNQPITTTTPPTTTNETLHVISGCTGATREALETKVQSYFAPITVADTALDDESVVTAMSQCLDKGDSSDSGKGSDSSKSASGGKGRGRDSVSDSGNHHRIRGCQDKGDSNAAKGDSSAQKYNKTLKDADSSHDTAKGIKDPVVVSDSSLDDKDVWKEYKKCVVDTSDSNKIDPSKTGKAKSDDSGHKQHIVKSCGADQDQKLKDVITAYKAKTSTKDLILTETSYNDVSIKQAVDACVSAGAKDTPTTPTTSPTSSSGVSGRQNFRENTSPIKDTQ